MDRLLELSLFVTKWMDDLPSEGDQGAPNAETRAPYIELFDFIWQALRTVLIRWDELSKNKISQQSDHVLEAIKFEVKGSVYTLFGSFFTLVGSVYTLVTTMYNMSVQLWTPLFKEGY